MSTPITLEDLQTAIETFRPELPTLLESDYPEFSKELDLCLQSGSVNRVLDLFSRYPIAHNRLLDALPEEEEEATRGLFGDPITALPYLYYRCENGPHALVLRRVEKRDAAGRALCPQHLLPMSRITSEDLRAAMKRLLPELPQLLGANSSAFAMELDAFLRGGSDNSLSELFEEYPAAYQRLLRLLA
jgi:hypothetical protein